MSKIRVGVVRGGPSAEYGISLKTGESVLRNLDADKYHSVDVLITPQGEWYMNGVRTDVGALAHHVDVIWNAMHGHFGEDGKAQRLFEQHQIPFTGSGSLASALGMHKGLAKDRFREASLLVPQGSIVEESHHLEDALMEITERFTFPVIVKPVWGGSSVATHVVRSFEQFVHAVIDAGLHGDVLVEELIEGTEATVCVIDSVSDSDYLVLFPVEIVPPDAHDFFDHEAKYSGKSAEICPGRFTLATHCTLRDLAIKAHRAIGARHYSRSDFIVSRDGAIYILEINTLPGLTEESLVPKALHASGVELHEFLDHVIGLALAET